LQEGDELARTMSFLHAGVNRAGHKIDAGQQGDRAGQAIAEAFDAVRAVVRDMA